MKVVIIGSGNVATVMGKKMKQHGIEIIQVYSRNEVEGKKLAEALSASYTSNMQEINKKGDLFLIAVSDTFIRTIAGKLKLKNKLIVHTAGSVSIEHLHTGGTVNCTYGVIYPLQSLKKENEVLPPIPVMIDGSDEKTISELYEFAAIWSENVGVANDDQRLKMHIAAVFSSNFTTFMYVLADEFCLAENLDFKMLLPLIEETCNRLKLHHPSKVQTGPAVRRDIQTINMHIDVLSKYPRLQGMYKVISAGILDQ